MELDKGRWYVRWFFWSLRIWDEFQTRDDSWLQYEDGTNLCHFIRVLFVWCPLVLLLNVAVYASGIAALTVAPIYFYGGAGYVWIIGAIALVAGIIIAVKFLFRQLVERDRKNERKKKSEPPKTVAPASAGPSFFAVLRKYVASLKQKVCPIITFKAQGDV